ncbi:SpoIIE family protein phosphatase [Streptomyces sp. SAJ15]|uniref:SpoIIE family protein phosphatase n=1 Tax=Streptomyces sp. SAJ15 TaxID=2011095 RepID=UPI0021B4D143|nr:SpoIIE family protein phosphatase [Streptomyces sp. SAJ15]
MPGRGDRPNAAGLLDEALVRAVHRAGASGGGVYLLDEDGRFLVLVVTCGAPGEITEPWWRLSITRQSPAPEAVREDRLVWVGGQEDMARLYPRGAAAAPHRMAIACAPLRGADRCWGALSLVWPAGRSPRISRRERGQVLFSARRVARVLDEAPHPPVIPDRPRVVPVRLATERPVRSALAAADLVERLPTGALALDLEGRVTFANHAALDLLDRTPEDLFDSVLWESVPWLGDPVCAETYRAAWLSGEPATLAVARPPDRWLTLRLYPDASGISILVDSEDTAVERPRSEVRPPPGTAAAVTTAAAGRIHQLVHLAAALTETVSVQDVVDLIAELILPTFGADGLIVSTTEAGRLKAIGHHGYAPDVVERLEGLQMDAELTPVGRALATGSPSFFASRAELARDYPDTPQLSDKHAWAFLPLITSGRPVGCCVLAYDHPHTFTTDERAILTPLASLIAQALDRARLYDAKHNLAHALQQRLLPHALPTVAGVNVAARYLPTSYGMDIGGDFYDLIRLTDTTAAAVIGDVEGHDVTAAALMGQVRTAIHSHATAGAGPDTVLARTNRDLADLDPGRFITCLYAQVDLAGRQVTLASAGHPPPLLHRPGRDPRVVAVDPGPPLGIGVELPYALSTQPLPAGSILALYTDGLVETPGADVDHTTADLARHLARSSDLPLHHLIDSLVRRARPTGQHADDIALLLLQPTS